MSKNYSNLLVKNYKQVHIIAKDRSFKYEQIANTPEFDNEQAAMKYWLSNKEDIIESNFYNDPIVLIRKEESYVRVKNL